MPYWNFEYTKAVTYTVVIPVPYADNQLLCSLDLQPEVPSNTTTIGLAVGRPTFAISPKITIYEGQKSEIFRGGGGHAPRPSRHAKYTLIV